jgi:cell division protein FtsI (penicillin-binding protein 3)
MTVDPKDQILARMYSVLTLLCLLPLMVVGQVVWVYLTEGAELQARGERQARSTVTIPAMRGTILDRAGRALATNTARYDLALDPTIQGFTEKQDTFFERLSALTGTSVATYRRRVRERSSPQYVRLVRGIDEPQAEAIEDWGIPGLILTPRFARRYNYGTTAAHVLGHVNSDGTGIAGLEVEYDEHLQGTDGWRAVKRDRRGHIEAFVGGQVVEPEHGQNLVLTIDLVRQTILEDELRRGIEASGAAWGTAVAMDPHTGAVLAMANVPTYNPNRPAAFADVARRNRAITDRIEPGSTFKLVGAAAAIEQDIVEMDDSIDTGDGWAVFHGRTMKDTHAHGTISFADAITVSSNVGMAKTVRQLDPGTFYQYARNFGFGQPTWIDLPGEVGGVLKKPSAWSGTTLTSMSIGYEVSATPLQVLTAYSALANGGLLVQPYVVEERQRMTGETLWRHEPDSVRRALRRSTVRALRPAFENVVEAGTATMARVNGLGIAGKTGTALRAVGGSYDPDYTRASFVGYFPSDAPEVALLIVIGDPESSVNGGAVAAPVFQRVARRWASSFPDVVQRLAAQRNPEPSARPAPIPTVQTRLADTADGAIPDFRGLSAREAVRWLQARGVNARVRGHGTIVEQWPAPDAPLGPRAVLRCQMTD